MSRVIEQKVGGNGIPFQASHILPRNYNLSEMDAETRSGQAPLLLGRRTVLSSLSLPSPEPEQELPPLPEWLQIPYLVPVKGHSSKIIYDSCANPMTRSGDGLYD